MNHTIKTVRSGSSQDRLSRHSFRVIVKNRITHQNVDPSHEKSRSQIIKVKNSIDSFEDAKHHLKNYIRHMKASSKIGNYDSKQHTNRSMSSQNGHQSKLITSSRVGLSSKKPQTNKAFVSTFLSPVQNRYSIRDTINQNTKDDQQTTKPYPNQDAEASLYENTRCRSVNENKPQGIGSKLLVLRSALEQHEQPLNQTFYSNNQHFNYKETSSRQRLADLQTKIENLLQQKLRMISSTDAFSSNQLQNRTAFKLLEKEMDRILFQIRRIKESQSSINRNTFEHSIIENDIEINKNIEVLQKKVKILERLIAQKLFESDNLKNQYLLKMKQHKRNKSQMPHKNSRSSTFYRQANQLHLSKFKPNKYEKGAIFSENPTTNKADFKKPLKSDYISPNKNDDYNSNTLTQPLPRSTYNCQYLMYGALPNQLIRVKSTQKDHKIFSSSMSPDKQKNMLEASTYKEDFITKKDNDPVNFKELDAYKDKFKSIQVNYGKERNLQKINNSSSVMDYYEDVRSNIKTKKDIKNNGIQTQNPQNSLPTLKGSSSKNLNRRTKKQQLSQPLLQTLNQTEKRMSMFEQQSLQKHHLFHQRIKSQIKHKNVYDQKYKFKSELIKQRIKKYVDGNSLNDKIRAHQTLAY